MRDDWPRVSTVLKAVGLKPDNPFFTEEGRARGRAVDEAIEALTYGYEVEVSPAAAPYVDAWKKFLVDSRFEPIAAQVVVRHPVWRFVGHPDVIGWLNGHRGVVDTKTGDDTGARYQVAAYVDAWSHEHPTEPATWGAILHLREDGTYRFDEVDLPRSIEIFRAAVLVYHAQTSRRAA